MLSDCTLESLQVLHNFFVILSTEVLEQTLNNLTATEVAPPPPPFYLCSKALSGLIMKRAVTGNQRNQHISYEMRQHISYEMCSQWNQSIISRGCHDNVSVNSKLDHHTGDPRGFARSHCLEGGGGGVGILNQRNFLQFSKTSVRGTSRFVSKKLEAA